MSSQTIPNFQPTVEEYAVHNARPEPMEFMWGGNRFWIPPCDQIGTDPCLFDDGTPIPGTVMVRDGYVFNGDGTMPAKGTPNWSAKEALRAVLGVDHAGNAISKLAQNGVSYLPVRCSRESYLRIREAGEARYRESLVGWATDTIQNYEEARNRAKQAGVDTKPPGQDFYKAQAILRAHAAKQQELYNLPSDPDEDDEVKFEIFAKAMAMKMAKEVAEEAGVDQVKLVEKMLENPKIAANIRKKYSLRKRGFMDPTEAPGAVQPPE